MSVDQAVVVVAVGCFTLGYWTATRLIPALGRRLFRHGKLYQGKPEQSSRVKRNGH